MGFEYTADHQPLNAETRAAITHAIATIAGVTIIGSLEEEHRLDLRFDHRPYRPNWPEDFSVYLHTTNCWVVFHNSGTSHDSQYVLGALQNIFEAVGYRMTFIEA